MAKLVVKQKKGQEKSAIIRLAYTTSFRKSSLLHIKWSDITKDRSGTIYLVKAVGKGGKAHTRPISEDLYHELLKIKTQPYYQRYNDDYIFHLSKDTIRNMMNTLKEEMHIRAQYKPNSLVFHSLRNVAAGYIKETGGDIEEIRDQLNHSDYNSLKHYMHKDTDYLNMAGIRMNEEIED
ncbi:tyrosine-type recombinase/integrase, partial [Paenibacillus polymyxa]|uniref:tyrosine-type recombinase/integrase n=1 Tax=Paenibacillus polymyxa TaxID=1406 RepID=UPI0014314758